MDRPAPDPPPELGASGTAALPTPARPPTRARPEDAEPTEAEPTDAEPTEAEPEAGETGAARPTPPARPPGVARPVEARPLTLARAEAAGARPPFAAHPSPSRAAERRLGAWSSHDGRWYGSSAAPWSPFAPGPEPQPRAELGSPYGFIRHTLPVAVQGVSAPTGLP